jgi:hypothetical protein
VNDENPEDTMPEDTMPEDTMPEDMPETPKGEDEPEGEPE